MKTRIYLSFAILYGIALTLGFIGLSAVNPVQAAPVVRCVNATGLGCSGGCGVCYASVQAAVDAASADDEIRIAGGTYTPGGTVASISSKKLSLQGGYSQDFTIFDPGVYVTLLDAEWGGSVISITNAVNVSLQQLTLTRGNGSGNCGAYGCGGGIYAKDTDLLVAQCTITNNVGSTSTGASGGGFYANNPGGIVTIQESRIISNTASLNAPASTHYGNGGGIYITSGTALLIKNEVLNNIGAIHYSGSGGIMLSFVEHSEVLSNTILNNRATLDIYNAGGGGLNINNCASAYVAGNTIADNQLFAGGYGGGIYVYMSNAHLARNRIMNNTTGLYYSGYGGGVGIFSTTPVTLSNNLIIGNHSTNGGGGVGVVKHAAPPSQAYLVNNTIAGNTPSGVVGSQYAIVTLTNNIIAGHESGLSTYSPSDVQINADTNLFWNITNPITGSNAILGDPLFTPDHHLRKNSPALDAGLDIPWLTVDLDGKLRPQDGFWDIGAFEGIGAYWDLLLPLIQR